MFDDIQELGRYTTSIPDGFFLRLITNLKKCSSGLRVLPKVHLALSIASQNKNPPFGGLSFVGDTGLEPVTFSV
jgi:hypothetical protein